MKSSYLRKSKIVMETVGAVNATVLIDVERMNYQRRFPLILVRQFTEHVHKTHRLLLPKLDTSKTYFLSFESYLLFALLDLLQIT